MTINVASELGTTVIVKNSRGRIAYIGEVDGYSGIWYGIDLEDPVAGKHDGTVNGRRYFTARHEKSGVLTRREHVQFPAGFYACFQEHYAELESMRSRQSENIVNVVLIRNPVAFVETEGVPVFSHCTTLIVHATLLKSFADVARLRNYFSVLQSLDISQNDFDVSTLTADLRGSWPSVAELAVNSCNLTAEALQELLNWFPAVEKLHIHSNKLARIELPKDEHGKITTQNLTLVIASTNDISSFEAVGDLFDLPRLTELNLNACKFEKVELPRPLPALETLSLKQNAFDSPDDILELEKLPKLTSLNADFSTTLQFGMTTLDVVIARFERLLFFNKIDISPVERKSSELLYVIRLSALPDVPPIHEATLRRLKTKYGIEDTQTTHVKQRYVDIVFECPDAPGKKEHTHRFLDCTQLDRALFIAQRKLRLDPEAFEAVIRRQGGLEEAVDKAMLLNYVLALDFDPADRVIFRKKENEQTQ